MTLGSPLKSDPWTLVLERGGELGRLIGEHDWASTPLGPMTDWPATLKTALAITLATPSPMMLAWGEDRILFYNDAARIFLGPKHPERALGLPSREVYHEIWETIGPVHIEVMQTGRTVLLTDVRFILQALVPHHEVYIDVSHVALTDHASGQIVGIHLTILEKTRGVIGARRLQTLRDAALRAVGADSDLAAYHACLKAIAETPLEVPAALVYLAKEGDEAASLVAAVGLSPEDRTTLERVPLVSTDGEAPPIWPLALAARTRRPEIVTDLAAKLPNLPKILDIEAPHTAVVLALTTESQPSASAFLVALATPLQPLDEGYLAFFALLGSTLASAATAAEELARERRRAEALAALDEAKTAFFSNVNHELRTPLTLMLGPLADLIASGSAAGKVGETLELVHRNGLRLQKLVNTLLDMSRLQAGSVEGVFEPIDLAAETREVASMFQAAIEKEGLRFLVDVEAQAVAMVDRDMWEKIVLNLLSNAHKHTFEGEIEVRLRKAEGAIKLVVRDTGVGIPEAELPRVFERFHRVHGARSRTHEGSGIGLSLVRDLVRLHQGEITVQSRLDQGTTFTVRLPASPITLPPDPLSPEAGAEAPKRRAPDPLLAEAPRARLAAMPLAQRPGKERILVIDDNADMCAYITSLLEKHWNVEIANDGTAALCAIRSSPPDLVLSDVMMPELDGFQLLRAIREDPRTVDLPVILISARASEAFSAEGFAAGANDYLIKPFSSHELVARVATQLALERARVVEKTARDRLQQLFSQAPVAISVVRGEELRFELANSHYEAIAGRSGLVGKSFREAFPEFPDDAHVFAIVAKVRSSAQAFSAPEYRVSMSRRGDGTLEDVFFMFTVQPLREPDGSVDAILTVAVDVTEQVRLREESARLAEAERFAREQAESASRAKDEFLATASHELRTPLNAILGWTRLLRMGKLDGAASARALETIERNAHAQVQLIEDILDGSRIITGKLHLEIRPLDMTALVVAAVDSVRPAAEAKSIEFAVMTDPAAKRITGDPDRLQQVVWNLVNNAIKFTPKGGRVEVRLERVGTSVDLTVTDSGQGISPEFLPHVFERFRQADGSTTRRHGGLGLGLALVRHLVEAHGGTVRAESDGIGHGARFVVTLPVRAGFEQAPSPKLQSSPPPAEAQSPAIRLDGVRVLVVDAEVDVRDLVATVLRESGAEVSIAPSVERALELLSQWPPTVLVSDIGMPGTDGYALIRRLRAERRPELAQIPAVALTAYAREEDRRHAKEAGFQAYVAKPVEPAELLRVVVSVLRTERP